MFRRSALMVAQKLWRDLRKDHDFDDPEFCDSLRSVIRFLEECPGGKRPRSKLTLDERAASAGVSERLKEIPEDLRLAAQSGCPDAKKAVQKIQIANQQIVARAEKSQTQKTSA